MRLFWFWNFFGSVVASIYNYNADFIGAIDDDLINAVLIPTDEPIDIEEEPPRKRKKMMPAAAAAVIKTRIRFQKED